MTRALDPEVVAAIWETVQTLIPPPCDDHPLGCHRPRVPDRVCFWGILIRLVTGSSWVDIEQILDGQVSDTTLRARRDEWINAGVFDALKDQAIAAFDRIIGLDLSEVALDGSLHKAPYGGEGTGPNPTDRAKLGWKWSVGVEAHGIPIGWVIDGANRNDTKLIDPTLDAIAAVGLLADIGTLHLDRGYDYPAVRRRLNAMGLHDLVIQRRGTKTPGKKQPLNLGLRWIVEATNSWWSNYGHYVGRVVMPRGECCSALSWWFSSVDQRPVGISDLAEVRLLLRDPSVVPEIRRSSCALQRPGVERIGSCRVRTASSRNRLVVESFPILSSTGMSSIWLPSAG